MKTKYSQYMRFFHCPSCEASNEKSSLRDPTGPCPECGADSLEFISARWRIEVPETGIFGDVFRVLGFIDWPECKWTVEPKE